jgi:pyruvate/2-oxoglutarate dehydrogenase complex dihydrolipoamide dehydrogenase (E3) component
MAHEELRLSARHVLLLLGGHRRDGDVAGLGLDKAGVKVVAGGKIEAKDEQTNVPHM